jgi:hypothetical protein
MNSRSRAAISVAALLPLFVVVVSATGVPTMVRAVFGSLFLVIALVVVARAAAAGGR